MAARKENRKPSSTRMERRTLAGLLAALALSLLTLAAPYLTTATAKDKDDKNSGQKQALAGLPATDLSEDEAVVHALNRLGYGPRPGDVERVKRLGLARWIDEQLHPESIDDSATEARLTRFPTLVMSSRKLIDKFPQPQVEAKREGMTLEQYRKEQQDQQQDQQAMQLAAVIADTQRDDMPAQENVGNSNAMLNYQNVQTPQRIIAELSMAKVDRAVYSQRQLYEQRWWTSGSITSTFLQGKGRIAGSSLPTNAMPFARMPWASSAICWRPRRKVRRCFFTSTTGRASIRKRLRACRNNKRSAAWPAAPLAAGDSQWAARIRIKPKRRSRTGGSTRTMAAS